MDASCNLAFAHAPCAKVLRHASGTTFTGNALHHRPRGVEPVKPSKSHSHLPPTCALKLTRRAVLQFSLAAAVPFLPRRADATSGLHIFPLQEPLENTYYLMRAAETNSDANHIINSNPVNKLSLEMHSLTPNGVSQAIQASDALAKLGLTSDAWLWPSVTISAFETAEILASRLRIRRENLVPEFAFLDARGVGGLDGRAEDLVRGVVSENDMRDSNWRPIAGEDGTPNDSTEDVFVRVRQLLSKLETQYSGENIVVISPDSDPLSILQATLVCEDLRSHHNYEFAPGEVRRVRELVTDMFGKVLEPGDAKVIYRPRGKLS